MVKRAAIGSSATFMIAMLAVSATATASQVQNATALGNGEPQTLNFGQFDPSQGTLQGVQLQLDAGVAGTAQFQSFESGGPANISASFGGNVALSAPDGSSIASAQPYAYASGTISSNGAQTLSASGTQTVTTATQPVPLSASILGAFTGTGSVGLPVSASIQSSVSGPLNLNASVASSSNARVTLNYLAGGSQTPTGGSFTGGVVITNITNPGTFLQFGTVTSAPQVRTVADQTTGWQTSLSFAKFNPRLGTLVGVNLSLTSDLIAHGSIENLDAAAASVSLTQSSQVSLGLDGKDLLDSSNTITNAANLGADATAAFTQDPVTNNVAVSDYSDVALFTGTGDVTLGLDALGFLAANAGGNFDGVSRGEAGAIVSISYTYLPDPQGPGGFGPLDAPGPLAAAPEPASASVLVLALTGLGVARRRRSKG